LDILEVQKDWKGQDALFQNRFLLCQQQMSPRAKAFTVSLPSGPEIVLFGTSGCLLLRGCRSHFFFFFLRSERYLTQALHRRQVQI
jgi:hypothetical protein